VRRRGQQVSRTFRLKSQADAWAREAETAMLTGKSERSVRVTDKNTFGALVDLHIDDMREVSKSPRRSKQNSLEKLKRDLGRVALRDLSRERLIAFGKCRANEGAGPVTIGMDLGYVRTVLIQATAIHRIETPTDLVLLARTALRRLGLIAKGKERDRRPTRDELDRIERDIPAGKIVHVILDNYAAHKHAKVRAWLSIVAKSGLPGFREK
jgi:hypothetical protein